MNFPESPEKCPVDSEIAGPSWSHECTNLHAGNPDVDSEKRCVLNSVYLPFK